LGFWLSNFYPRVVCRYIGADEIRRCTADCGIVITWWWVCRITGLWTRKLIGWQSVSLVLHCGCGAAAVAAVLICFGTRGHVGPGMCTTVCNCNINHCNTASEPAAKDKYKYNSHVHMRDSRETKQKFELSTIWVSEQIFDLPR